MAEWEAAPSSRCPRKGQLWETLALARAKILIGSGSHGAALVPWMVKLLEVCTSGCGVKISCPGGSVVKRPGGKRHWVSRQPPIRSKTQFQNLVPFLV